MTVKGGSNQACAACKYQRRKCKPDCPLAPYFLSNQSKQFLNAHRLFGLRNILRILKYLTHLRRTRPCVPSCTRLTCDSATLGCVGAIQTLQIQIQQAQEELQLLNLYLDAYRGYYHHQQLPLQSSSPPLESPGTLSLFEMCQH